MQTSGELIALLNLIEDPDEEIYQMVTSRLLDLGDEVIPLLEDHKQSVSDSEQLHRLDSIISKISISTLEDALLQWKQNGEQSLLDAVLTISMYINRETDKHQFFFEVEKIRKNVWLELNDYLTPLEEVIIVNRIIFDYYKLKGLNTDYRKIEEFDLMYLFSNKKANSYGLAALYLIIAELLGISLKPISIPQQNLLSYLMEEELFAPEAPPEIVFYLDPINGQVYTHKDVENYLKKINYSSSSIKLETNTSAAFIKKWLLELAKSEKENGFLFKEKELIRIARMMEGD